MRKIMITLCLALTIATSLAATHRQDSTARMADGVAVSYSLINDQLTLHEPIIVAFVVKNNLSRQINLDLGENHKGGFSLTVTRPNGARIKLPRYIPESLYIAGKLSLEPGQTYEHKLLLNEWDDFGEVGKYEVEISLDNPILVAGGGQVKTSTKGVLSLEIGPRNPAVLMQRCAELADQVEQASSYVEAMEPTLVLSYVKDEVAVPYLARVLEARKLPDGYKIPERIAIEGLGRIATDEAIDILISLLQSPSVDIILWAGQTLGHIERESSDPTLKEKIKRAVSDPGPNERVNRALQRYKKPSTQREDQEDH